MPADQTTKRVYDLIDPIVSEVGCELLDVEMVTEFSQRVLRVSIDKEGGVNVDDCSQVSSAIEDLIEVEAVVTGRYNLEVSSPGINRPLTKTAHFNRALDKTVQIQTREKINGRANYKGILKRIENDEVFVQVDDQEFRVPLDLIRKAHLIAL